MPNKIRPKRTLDPGKRPITDAGEEGNLYLNVPDRQLGYHDDKGAPVDLIAVRTYYSGTAYKTNDIVAYNGKLYRSLVDQPANSLANFNPHRWVEVTGSGGAGTPGNLPSATAADIGKALVVGPGAQVQWGAAFNFTQQDIYGGIF